MKTFTASLFLAVCLALGNCQKDQITDHLYSRYYYVNNATNESNKGNCGYFTCKGYSQENDPVNSSRIYITLKSPIFNGTLVRGKKVYAPLSEHFSVSYSYNTTGKKEYSYTLHLKQLNSSLAGLYSCKLGVAASRRATPELLYPKDIIAANHSYNTSTSMLRVYDVHKAHPRVYDVVLRSKNGSTQLFRLTKDSNLLNIKRWACEKEVYLDYGTRRNSSYPCGYVYHLSTIFPAKNNTNCVSTSAPGSLSSCATTSIYNGNNATTPVTSTVTPDTDQRSALLLVSAIVVAVLIAAIIVCVLYAVCTHDCRGNVKNRGKIFYGFVLVVLVVSLVFLIVFTAKENQEFCSNTTGSVVAIVGFVLWFLLTVLFIWKLVTQVHRRKLCCGKVENFSKSGRESEIIGRSSIVKSIDGIQLSQKHVDDSKQSNGDTEPRA